MTAELTDHQKLAVLATLAHEVFMGAYPEFEAKEKAHAALQRVGLLSLEAVLALATQPATQGAEPMGFVHYRSTGLGSTVREAVLTPAGLELPEGALLYTAPPPTAEVEKLREEHQAHEEVRPSVATKPLWAKCPTCDACWPAAYLPMPLHAMARAASRAVCPNNCAAKPLVADQNDGVLLEPLRAFPLSTWNEDLGDVCWWHWTGHEWAGEAAWIGRPIDSNWPGYHTHWTPHPNFPEAPKA